MSVNATWGDVNEGDIIEGTNASLWSVVSIGYDNKVVLLNTLTGKEYPGQPHPDKPVVIVTRASEALRTAREIVGARLGGREIATKNDHDEYLCPVEIEDTGAMYSHLYIFHGMYGASVAQLPAGGLLALHGTAHDTSEQNPSHVPHVHDPAYHQTVR